MYDTRHFMLADLASFAFSPCTYLLPEGISYYFIVMFTYLHTGCTDPNGIVH